MRLHPFGDDPQSWKVIGDWRVHADADAPADQWGTLKLAALKLQNTGPVVKFEGCDDRNGSEKLVGLYVAVPRHELPERQIGHVLHRREREYRLARRVGNP